MWRFRSCHLYCVTPPWIARVAARIQDYLSEKLSNRRSRWSGRQCQHADPTITGSAPWPNDSSARPKVMPPGNAACSQASGRTIKMAAAIVVASTAAIASGHVLASAGAICDFDMLVSRSACLFSFLPTAHHEIIRPRYAHRCSAWHTCGIALGSANNARLLLADFVAELRPNEP